VTEDRLLKVGWGRYQIEVESRSRLASIVYLEDWLDVTDVDGMQSMLNLNKRW